MLVIPNTKESKLIITGKLYEYLKSKRPILAVANPEGDAAKIIYYTESGSVYDYNDTEGIKAFIKLDQHPTPRNIDQYSRKVLTESLADVFKGVAD